MNELCSTSALWRISSSLGGSCKLAVAEMGKLRWHLEDLGWAGVI